MTGLFAMAMDHLEVGEHWDRNAEAWTTLARQGCDSFRDLLNTPHFLGMLPDVRGLRGLDVGCGEGSNTRLLAGRGGRMAAIDLSSVFLGHAAAAEREHALGIGFARASGLALPFRDQAFDFVTAFMSFMDMPEHPRVFAEAHRVLRPGGFLQFSITHPCFQTATSGWVKDETGKRVAWQVADYFRELAGECEEWHFSSTPQELKDRFGKFKIPRFTRTLSSWLNLLLDAGFTLERFCEPQPDDDLIRRRPNFAAMRIITYSLIVRARRPTS
jgi:ubiquinone/menaquinone biosynthesis C-methylase UbiE